MSKEDAQSPVDDAVLRLKSQRNSLSPICRIPDEILSEIYLLAKGSAYCGEDYLKDPFGWVRRFTHVCRHLRYFALNSPHLWSKGPWPLHNLEFLQEMLRRSNNIPLTIKVNLALSRNRTSGLKVLLEHNRRIKHLAVYMSLRDWEDLDVFPMLAPQLEHLSLSCRDARYSPIFALDDVFLTPTLRHLSLNGFSVNWDSQSPLGRGLISLTLRRLSDPLPTWNQIYNALHEMPNLEVLDLQDAFQAEEASSSWDLPALNLHSLRKLVIGKCSVRDVEYFLSRVTFPSTAKVIITRCSNASFTDMRDDLPAFLARITQSISDATNPNVFRTLIIKDRQRHFACDDVCVRLFTETLDDQEMLCNANVHPQLELDLFWVHQRGELTSEDSEGSIISMVVTAIFESGIGPLLHEVTNVYLGHLLQPREVDFKLLDMLKDTIGQLRKVCHIVATQCWFRSLATVLILGIERNEPESSRKPLYFPDLSELYPEKTNDTFLLKSLHDCLVWRARASSTSDEKVIFALWDNLGNKNLTEESVEGATSLSNNENSDGDDSEDPESDDGITVSSDEDYLDYM
ncbi:hypothetical protein BDN70DRAFT_877119 [Pholiota conissans]|uniref:F-box domain-containing protein n=1 Tax=Pholiota conissans TaxID=109636 RepID=A0A9P6CVJ1_9AGAR|nr:hypothetical protein BDN70DRAFT_877119 [Pholiota conissans]